MRHRRHARAIAAAGLAWAAFTATGCMTKTIRTPVFEENFVEVYLRHQERMGSAVDAGFSHPVTVAPVRITNMLARIEVRKEGDKERQPAIPTNHLYPVGEGISRALAKADPTQEVVVMAKERKRSMGIFTQDFLTSLLVWAQDDKLYIKIGQLDSPLSKNPNDRIPEPKRDEIVGKSRVVPSEGINAENVQLVSANWRDPLFKDSGVISVRAGGKVVRRTVLMDSGEESSIPAAPQTGAPVPPEGLSPEALRALADLEDERRRGQVTEADYQSKRRQILAGETPAASP
ncbi:MAG: hypothetical protein DCC71_09070 [Proteobacteria bacterium]|nr:MAG: hypothetical protein DCC71_09070 [Pseudomonadota bacterium]